MLSDQPVQVRLLKVVVLSSPPHLGPHPFRKTAYEPSYLAKENSHKGKDGTKDCTNQASQRRVLFDELQNRIPETARHEDPEPRYVQN